MNDRELNDLLKRAPLPEPPAEWWNELPGRVARRLGETKSGATVSLPGFSFPRLAWAFGLIAVCVLIGFSIGRRHDRAEAAADPLLQNPQVVRGMMGMFPRRLRAIVDDAQGLRLELSDRDDVPESAPVLLEVCDGRKCSTIVTFSGQEVRIAGRAVTVLSDARGGVIVMGEGFLWTSRDPGRAADGLRIQARELAAS